ncbi:zinc ribbon domain-containing protein [Microbacterium oxydans]|uniref:zinc ribbon domain-containing protein n=1 Tax=Microbacterium oxydans TaxID=82380 RepID=UPI001141770B|nr:zinc ribbon domain-containing protein [Microbacterium oxydans]KAB1893644.1 zinc ribbon domain-containing protein [Microbacterium oxydans]GED38148.1 hypothetical protein MOX01_12900 [Microbacterium oxydans]
MPVYAHCDSCGHDFESQGLAISGPGSAGVTLVGNAESCPRCGREARIMDGRFKISEDAIEVIDAPPWSRDLIIRLTPKQRHRIDATVRWAQLRRVDPATDDEKTVRALEKTIEENVPAIQPWLEKFRGPTSSNIAAWLAVLISILMWITSNNSGGVTPQQLEQILDETVRSAQSEQSQSTRAQPTGPAAPLQSPEPFPQASELPSPGTH